MSSTQGDEWLEYIELLKSQHDELKAHLGDPCPDCPLCVAQTEPI